MVDMQSMRHRAANPDSPLWVAEKIITISKIKALIYVMLNYILYVYTHTYVDIYLYVYTYLSLSVYVYMCMCVCVCVCVYIYIYFKLAVKELTELT